MTNLVFISNLQSKVNKLKLYMMTMALLYEMFDEEITVTVDTQLQKQEEDIDCGVFCIAITSSFLYGSHSW